jgi:hypothetical protein
MLAKAHPKVIRIKAQKEYLLICNSEIKFAFPVSFSRYTLSCVRKVEIWRIMPPKKKYGAGN